LNFYPRYACKHYDEKLQRYSRTAKNLENK
jgi:hypothetical protein